MERQKIHSGYIFGGITTLVSVSFLDNIRGPLLPVLCESLNIPYSSAGLFLTLGNVAAVISTLALGSALKKFSEKAVTTFICVFCSIPGLLAPFIEGLASLLALGLVMGASVALMGSICNILTIKGSPVRLRGRLLSLQQVMYGVGSFLGPICFAFFYKLDFPWWTSITMMSLINLILGFIVLKILPVHDSEHAHEGSQSSNKYNLAILLPIVLFAIYVGGEVLTSMWMSTFFTKVASLSIVESSQLMSFFFLTISGSRFLSFLLVRPKWERATMIACLCSGILFTILALNGHPKLLPLAGLVGPFFPLFMAQVAHVFPKAWKSLTIWIFTAIQSCLGLIHFSVGHLTELIGIKKAFYIAPSMMFLSLVMVLIFFRQHQNP